MQKQVRSILAGGVLALLALMPFHAFLSVWLGSLFGHQSLFQAWKELLVVIMAAVVAVHGPTRRTAIALVRQPVNLLILGFILLAVTVSLLNHQTGSGFWFGLKTDIEFLVVFMIAQVASSKLLEDRTKYVILAAASIVAAFGVLQATLLPPDFLANFGYSSQTIEPFALLYTSADGLRILSTLGGPNQLGSFLILPISLLLHTLLRKRQWLWLVPLGLCTFTLVHSYSRSAWLGTIAAILLTLTISLPKRIRRPAAIAAVVVLAIVSLAGVTALRHNLRSEEYLLHGQLTEKGLEGSDDARLASITKGLRVALDYPLGKGLGTAGPASFHTDSALITENFYLQLAIEVGILGLLLFAAICTTLGKALWDLKDRSELAVPLLAALAGISVVNLFLHGWADSSTALVFWTAAGVTLGRSYESSKTV